MVKYKEKACETNRCDRPIIHFKNNYEFDVVADYWKHVLQLDDWCIRAERICKPDALEGAYGASNVSHATKTAHIVVNACPVPVFPRWCEELALVHELLHCVVVVPEDTSETIEGLYYTLKQEQLVETMAKSMLMAKYAVDVDWFAQKSVNFEYEGVVEQ